MYIVCKYVSRSVELCGTSIIIVYSCGFRHSHRHQRFGNEHNHRILMRNVSNHYIKNILGKKKRKFKRED